MGLSAPPAFMLTVGCYAKKTKYDTIDDNSDNGSTPDSYTRDRTEYHSQEQQCQFRELKNDREKNQRLP